MHKSTWPRKRGPGAPDAMTNAVRKSGDKSFRLNRRIFEQSGSSFERVLSSRFDTAGGRYGYLVPGCAVETIRGLYFERERIIWVTSLAQWPIVEYQSVKFNWTGKFRKDNGPVVADTEARLRRAFFVCERYANAFRWECDIYAQGTACKNLNLIVQKEELDIILGRKITF